MDKAVNKDNKILDLKKYKERLKQSQQQLNEEKTLDEIYNMAHDLECAIIRLWDVVNQQDLGIKHSRVLAMAKLYKAFIKELNDLSEQLLKSQS